MKTRLSFRGTLDIRGGKMVVTQNGTIIAAWSFGSRRVEG